MPLDGLLAKPAAADLPAEGRAPFFVDFPFQRTIITSEEMAKALPSLPKDAEVQPGKGDLVLNGYASTWVEDRDREFISRHAYDKTLDAYLKLNPIVLWQHERNKSFGQVADGVVDDFGLATASVIRQPEQGEDGWRISAFNDVKAGIVRTHSVGGFFEREIIEGEVLITDIELFEISCVSIPSNPLSIYEASIKSVHGLPMTNSTAAVRQMMQLLSLEPISDPQLAGLSARQRESRYHELSSMFVEAKGVSAPGFDTYRSIVERVDGGDATAATLGDLQELLGTLGLPDLSAAAAPAADAKKGRVISKSNEGKLRKAHDAIGEVLDSVAEVEVEDDKEVEGEAKGEDDTKSKPPNLRSGTPSKSCGNCKFFTEGSGGKDGQGMCSKYKFPVSKGQLCDSYQAKGKSALTESEKLMAEAAPLLTP